MNLQRFNFIDKHKSNEKIISMYDFGIQSKKRIHQILKIYILLYQIN